MKRSAYAPIGERVHEVSVALSPCRFIG